MFGTSFFHLDDPRQGVDVFPRRPVKIDGARCVSSPAIRWRRAGVNKGGVQNDMWRGSINGTPLSLDCL